MNSSNSCDICKRSFSDRKNLRKHIKKFHPDKLEELAPLKTFECAAICEMCAKTFVRNSALMQHIRKYHADKLDPKKYTYKCDKCLNHFSHARNLNHHMKLIHQENSSGLKCILCSNDTALKKSDLIKHFRTVHAVNIVMESLQFSSLEEFEIWKKQEERERKESFIKTRGTYKWKNYSKALYTCHRSGFFKSSGKNIHNLKTQQSKKINGYCPAEICVEKINNKFQVKYISTHVGHGNNLDHLNISETHQLVPEEIFIKTELSNESNDNYKDRLVAETQKIRIEISNILDTVTTFEELDVINKLLAPVLPTLNAIRDRRELDKCHNNTLGNKNMSKLFQLLNQK
ncbi:zinc finger protein Xfin-like isoform X2 [Harmonia axyridis]|uniref:zinc finger protein Xfin-like isoform X2 n=1 Tax=Harmonia axyridis TaxID=115357 RepID=UPI001E2778B6|nr:zinc finger protein Xfin-like isoform X2 [Harmonia axyridis]